jgi:hypothetical protein
MLKTVDSRTKYGPDTFQHAGFEAAIFRTQVLIEFSETLDMCLRANQRVARDQRTQAWHDREMITFHCDPPTVRCLRHQPAYQVVLRVSLDLTAQAASGVDSVTHTPSVTGWLKALRDLMNSSCSFAPTIKDAFRRSAIFLASPSASVALGQGLVCSNAREALCNSGLVNRSVDMAK